MQSYVTTIIILELFHISHLENLTLMDPFDCDEHVGGLDRGLPVVSVSIGESAEFLYGHTRDENKLEKVLLESGDVLIFGGKSRRIFHGVRRILPPLDYIGLSQVVKETGLISGRLNLTLKQFQF
ncbi:putative DNA oxidative demethylase [Helianthus annuus]|nr:putative DNA oxidative demethylase [Helianthus annuus]